MTALATRRPRTSVFQSLFSTADINAGESMLPDESSTIATLPEARSATATKTGSATITTASNGDQAIWPSVPQTTATEVDQQMHTLMITADANDAITFIAAYRAMDWDQRDAEDHAQAVKLALQAGAHLIARDLAQQGADRFPDHSELQKLARILTLPTTKSIPGPPDKTWAANRAWLQNNREAYRGSWVALKNGELLGVANDFQELKAQVGPIKGSDILVTQIW